MPRIATVYGKSPERMPFDFPDVLAAIAPAPIFVNAPLRDANFAVDGVKDCVAQASTVYDKIFHAPGRLVAVHPDCEHDFPPESREQAYTFLDKYLIASPKASPLKRT
jgi:hypothetical protein